MYDPLALCVGVPALAGFFKADELTVNGVKHRVYGVSKESTGVCDGDALSRWLIDAFMEGIRQSLSTIDAEETQDRHKETMEIEALKAKVASLEAEVLELRSVAPKVWRVC